MEKNNNMKTVLAELHELINDLEDQGLIAEASTLQEVFVRVAEEADMDEMAEPTETDDLSNDVAGLLKSHSAAEVLAEIAKQMGGAEEAPMSDTETMSFAFGDEPEMSRNDIVSKYSKEYLDSMGRMNPSELAAKASEETGTNVRAEEITRGAGYNSQAEMAKELSGPTEPKYPGYSPNN
jgi:hypothetical protein